MTTSPGARRRPDSRTPAQITPIGIVASSTARSTLGAPNGGSRVMSSGTVLRRVILFGEVAGTAGFWRSSPGTGPARVLLRTGSGYRLRHPAVESPPVSTSESRAAVSPDDLAVTAERCAAQLLRGDAAGSAEEVAGRLLAIQAQDPRGARLAIRARSAGLPEARRGRSGTLTALVASRHRPAGLTHGWTISISCSLGRDTPATGLTCPAGAAQRSGTQRPDRAAR